MRVAGLLGSGRRRAAVLTIGAVIIVLTAAGVTVATVSSATVSGTGVSSAPVSAPPSPIGAATVSQPVDTSGFPTGAGQPGIFTDRCGYSHEAADDPILAPNDPGAAMHHNFYGNTATSASSTATALVGGASTCTTTADASAYWTPVLYQNGVALTPGSALIYWRRPVGDTEAVQTVPVGLQMIAGNESATEPQARTVTAWTCSGTISPARSTNTPHDCPAGSDLRLVVTFPSCWDGRTLTGAGQTNVAYRTSTGCPASHPIQIPQIVFHVNYPTASAANLTVSMTPTMQGSTDTEHVDFINGWTQATLNADVSACDATSTRCGPVTGPQATPKGPATRRAARRH
jgi:Domain of unknown function (DUF1996)